MTLARKTTWSALGFGLILLSAVSIYRFTPEKVSAPEPAFDVTIQNESEEWTISHFSPPGEPYRLPFARITALSFGTDKDNLYVKFQLAGALPNKITLNDYDYDDVMQSAVYRLTIDENYFDAAGNKNPGGPDARLKMSFYDNKGVDEEEKGIRVDGELVGGGLGHDYFIVKYPYRQIFFYEYGQPIVVRATSEARTDKLPSGASGSEFRNKDRAVTPEDDREIRVTVRLRN